MPEAIAEQNWSGVQLSKSRLWKPPVALSKVSADFGTYPFRSFRQASYLTAAVME
jgi:hypothetical protein